MSIFTGDAGFQRDHAAHKPYTLKDHGVDTILTNFSFWFLAISVWWSSKGVNLWVTENSTGPVCCCNIQFQNFQEYGNTSLLSLFWTLWNVSGLRMRWLCFPTFCRVRKVQMKSMRQTAKRSWMTLTSFVKRWAAVWCVRWRATLYPIPSPKPPPPPPILIIERPEFNRLKHSLTG